MGDLQRDSIANRGGRPSTLPTRLVAAVLAAMSVTIIFQAIARADHNPTHTAAQCSWEWGGVQEVQPAPCPSMPVQRVHLVTDTATATDTVQAVHLVTDTATPEIKLVEVTNQPTEISVNNFPTATVDVSGSHVTATVDNTEADPVPVQITGTSHVTATVDNTEANPVPVSQTSETSQTVTAVGGWNTEDSEHLERITVFGIVAGALFAFLLGAKLVISTPFGRN